MTTPRSVTLPRISFQTFDPTADAAGQKKGAAGEAARPIGEAMLNVVERQSAAKPHRRMSPEEIRKIEEERLERWIVDRLKDAQVEPTSELVTLSPALATLLMRRNPSNRGISETNLNRIKSDIMGGRWEFNGEPIIVSRDGLLNDGQHRCKAVIETGQSIRMVIVFGPERKSRFTVDQGAVRTVGNYLSMNGHKDGNALATVGNYAWQWKSLGYLTTTASLRPTKSQVLHAVGHYSDLAGSLIAVSQNGATVVATRAMLAFAHWAFAQATDREAADRFINSLIKGAGLNEGDPILYCRNRLIAQKSRADIQGRAELLFKCWNAHRLGQSVEAIRLGGKKLPKLER